MGVLAVLLSLSGCATVRIEGEDGSVRVERQFGLLSVQLVPENASVFAQTKALGVMRTWDGVTMGYYNGSVVGLSGNDCRIVVWVEDAAQVQRLRELLRGNPDICEFSEGGNGDGNEGDGFEKEN